MAQHVVGQLVRQHRRQLALALAAPAQVAQQAAGHEEPPHAVGCGIEVAAGQDHQVPRQPL